MIIVVASIKGGTGKTTLATNLAIMAAKNASDVLLVDSDAQKSAFDFSAAREEEGHNPSITSTAILGKSTGTELRKLAPKFDDIIVDVGGHDSTTLRSAIVAANVLIIPFLPSQFDAWTLEMMDSIVEDALVLNETLRIIPVLNKVDPNPKSLLVNEVNEFAKDLKNIKVPEITVCARVAYRKAIGAGLSVTECKGKEYKKAIHEMNNLYEEIFKNA